MECGETSTARRDYAVLAIGLVMERGRVYGIGVSRGERPRIVAREKGVEIGVADIPCPGSLRGASIVVLTDLHIHSWRDAERFSPIPRLLESVLGENGHVIIVLGGDTWDEATRGLEPVRNALSVLGSIPASLRVAVIGNHEISADEEGVIPLEEGLRLLREYGYRVLVDEAVEAFGARIAGFYWRDSIGDYPLSRVRGSEIIVSHSPDVFSLVDWSNVVVVAGHTHGGQVCLPGARSIITNSRRGYTWGIYRDGARILVVSRGLGEKTRLRLFCPRQVLVVKCN